MVSWTKIALNFAERTTQTVSMITWFFLAVLSNPACQQIAQEEIDRVVLPGHLPSFHDMESLPYVTALVKEVMRWGNVAPIGAFQASRSLDYNSPRISTACCCRGRYIPRISYSSRSSRHRQLVVSSVSYEQAVIIDKIHQGNPTQRGLPDLIPIIGSH
jgi:hypothetical protein